MPLSLLTVNVGAPSLDRARRQLHWLAARPAPRTTTTKRTTPRNDIERQIAKIWCTELGLPEADITECRTIEALAARLATEPAD